MIELNKEKVLIIGAALSGTSAASLLCGKCDEIVLYDANTKGKLDEESVRKELPADFSGRIILGELTGEVRDGATLVILSPGVPKDLPFVLEMEERGAKIIGEVELAYYFTKGRIAAITGTNGKTTTTALTGHIIAQCVKNTFVVGNIGVPCTREAAATTDDSITVSEMSSFQLDTIIDFKADASAVLNITPDHLDRHHTMENYINAKLNVAKNQDENGVCVLNIEDPILCEKAPFIKSKVVWFSSKRRLDDGLFYENGHIYSAKNGVATDIADTDKMQLIGVHNYENAMAAVAIAQYFGIPDSTITEALYSFKPVEHRIEFTAEKNGVKYYNDSKGTNPDASIKAVKSMKSSTLLIAGGYDKHSEYDEWIESFEGRIRYLVLMGQTREKIADCAKRHGFNNIVFVESMKEAVDFCAANAVPGENVLLSPCCASWGMFNNYEERGRIFKDLVNAL